MNKRLLNVLGLIGLFLAALFAMVLAGIIPTHTSSLGLIWNADSFNNVQFQQSGPPNSPSLHLMNGQIPSLGWIVGRDCQRGIQAYLKTADINPDAALVGPGWVDPTTGKLLSGESDNCQSGTLSMDNVIKMIHNKGGKAYLTITMQTDGGGWTGQQQSVYIAEANQHQSYIDQIINEVKRGGYDGVIMDLEGAVRTYPNIQQLFATYNQRVRDALKPLHKPYGIALIHKVSDQDDYYNLNGFEDWSLLGHSADFIVVMSLDQSYFTPGPTVSIPWLKQLLTYTLKTMPQMLPNIIWEFPLYGATWHQNGANWVFDSGINYADAVKLVNGIPASQIDTADSNLNDPYAAHLVYTDLSGVTHAVWYHTGPELKRIIAEFQQLLMKVPRFASAHTHLQIAVWYRATWEPLDLWRSLVGTLEN